jgi:hypothetical protein
VSTLLSGLENALGATSSTASGSGGLSGIGAGLVEDYLYLPGFLGGFLGIDALAPLIGNAETAATTPVVPVSDGGAADGGAGSAAGGSDGAGDGGSGYAGDAVTVGSVGDAPTLGALSVPPSWLSAAVPPPLLPAGVPLAAPGDADFGAGLGFPFAFPGAAALGAAAGAGGAAAAASKYGSRLKVVARAPEAGYAPEPAASSAPGYPVPAAAYPTNGHAPPGYRPAIVYLPTNGHEPAKV